MNEIFEASPTFYNRLAAFDSSTNSEEQSFLGWITGIQGVFKKEKVVLLGIIKILTEEALKADVGEPSIFPNS